MQIAVVVPDDQVDAIDRLIPDEFRSRGEVVRVALADLLATRDRRRIDQQYIDGLEASADVADLPHRLSAGDPEPAAWNDIPW